MDNKYKFFNIGLYGEIVPYNHTISKTRARIFYKYANRNGSYITDEFSEILLKSLPYTPIKGIYNANDFEGHSDIPGKYDGEIYGIIPENANIQWEDHIDPDGQTRTYACADVLLFTTLIPESKEICNKQLSMEIYGDSIEGSFQTIDGIDYYVYTKGSFIGIQVLGDKKTPCFEGAGFYSLNSNIDKARIKMLFEAMNKEMEENSKMEKDKNLNILKSEKVKEDEKLNQSDSMEKDKTKCEEKLDKEKCETTEDKEKCETTEDKEKCEEKLNEEKCETTEDKEKCEEKLNEEKCEENLEQKYKDLDEKERKLEEELDKVEDEKDRVEDQIESKNKNFKNYDTEKIDEKENKNTFSVKAVEELANKFIQLKKDYDELNQKFQKLKEVEFELKTQIIEKYEKLLDKDIISKYQKSLDNYTTYQLKRELAYELVESTQNLFDVNKEEKNTKYMPTYSNNSGIYQLLNNAKHNMED